MTGKAITATIRATITCHLAHKSLLLQTLQQESPNFFKLYGEMEWQSILDVDHPVHFDPRL